MVRPEPHFQVSVVELWAIFLRLIMDYSQNQLLEQCCEKEESLKKKKKKKHKYFAVNK